MTTLVERLRERIAEVMADEFALAMIPVPYSEGVAGVDTETFEMALILVHEAQVEAK